MKYDIKGIDSDILIELYRNMLKSRMIEDKMIILLRQGKVSKWFSGIGQEAISAGVTQALENDEYFPMVGHTKFDLNEDGTFNTTRKTKYFTDFNGKRYKVTVEEA